MTTSLVIADSLLVVDVGAVSTRALLFDVVEGRYRFIAVGTSPTTAGAPYYNVSEGVRSALDHLRKITSRPLVGSDEQLIMPSGDDGSGVDTFAAVVSAGAPLKVVVVGLLEDVSLASARRLASTTYSKVVETISLNDRRRPDARIDAILRLRPDLIVVVGGIEDGASQSVLKLLEPVGLACYLMPEAQRPSVLFAGNKALRSDVKSSIGGVTNLHYAPNVRPTLEMERQEAAQTAIARISTRIRSRQLPGLEELNSWASGGLMPASASFGRVIRFLSEEHGTQKGVLGVDVGASATTIATAFEGELSIGVYPQFGLGSELASLLQHVSLEEITRWLTVDIPDDQVHEYLLNKALYPGSVPVTDEELAIEYAITRQVLSSAIKLAASGFPPQASSSGEGLLPWVEPIVATGSVLTNAPSLAHSALMLLDGLQPTGATTLVLDQNRIAPALGAAAAINPILAVQILDSGAFLHLGTVISPVGDEPPGTPILRLKVTYENGQEAGLEIKQGSLEVLPLKLGKSARLQLQPMNRYDVGMGAPGRGGGLRVMGGALGVIIDARGRPLTLPEDRSRRAEMYRKWLWTLGG